MNENSSQANTTTPIDGKELAHLIAAAEATFSNAEDLYDEAQALAKSGHHARAVFLHQISLEECGKLELLGAWIIGRFGGSSPDPSKFYASLTHHKAKNSINAYMLEVEGDELSAQEQGDWKAKHEAFMRMKRGFHENSNRAKNSALYVDIGQDKLETPKSNISKAMASEFKDRNERFLALMFPKLRLIQSYANCASEMEVTVKAYIKAIMQLRGGGAPSLDQILEISIEAMRKGLAASKTED